MINKYKFGFDFWSLLLFILMIIPTIFWSFIPAPNDILRADSVTPAIDMIATISQTIMIASLCLFINKSTKKVKPSPFIIATIICYLLYFSGWVIYYSGIVNPLIILDLTIPPCLAFLFCSIYKKNIISVISSVIFLICHLIFAVVNFII